MTEQFDLEHRIQAWELEIRCPNCGAWINGSSFLSSEECPSCRFKVNFKMEARK